MIATYITNKVTLSFDSVDHEYVVNTLRIYGFGPKLIMFFKTLYKNVSAYPTDYYPDPL